MKGKFLSFIIILGLVISMLPTATFAHNGAHSYSAIYIAPRYGNTSTHLYYDDGSRYVDHNYMWSTSQSFQAYYAENAYQGLGPVGMEIDTNFRGYDQTKGPDGSVLHRYVWTTGPYSESQSSKGVHWGSDAPYAYIDVTFSDSKDEPTVGLGSGMMGLANKGKWYNAWSRVSTKNPDSYGPVATYDDYKVVITRTHHHDSGWYGGTCDGAYNNPWCHFEDGHTTGGKVKAIPAWKGNAPDMVGFDWLYPTYSATYVAPSHDYNR